MLVPGFTPLFADVDDATWHLAPDALAAALEQRGEYVAAVLPCSTFGVAPPRAQTEAWERLCDEAGVPLVVDSAAGFGSEDENGQQ